MQEYSEDGTLIKGQDHKVLNSKYEEDKVYVIFLILY